MPVPADPDFWRSRLARVREPYDLRTLFATLQRDCGIPVRVIAKRGGIAIGTPRNLVTGRTRPTRKSVIGFLTGCGITGDQQELWLKTYDRIYPVQAPARPVMPTVVGAPTLDSALDPQPLRASAENEYGSDLILNPTRGDDRSGVRRWLAGFTEAGPSPVGASPSPAAAVQAASSAAGASANPIRGQWTPPAEPVVHFTGRDEELKRLSRWAADPMVRLIGVTAWGGAGKTALVTEWLERRDGLKARPGAAGVFGWSFYADASPDHWATALLRWAASDLGVQTEERDRIGATVLSLVQAAPVVLVLDGLEVIQDGHDGSDFGRVLDGTVREVLTGVCQMPHQGLVVLTSRFPFADLEGFDGSHARNLDLSPFTVAEGAELLAAAGGHWLPEIERRELVADVDGHALAVAALGAVLAGRPPTADLVGLRADLTASTGTSARVGKVLDFYATRLAEPDRYLVAAVALFARPVTPATVLTVAAHEAFRGHLSGWSPARVEIAARARLAGLLSWNPDGTLTAHPLVREAFRPLVLGAAQVAVDAALTGVPRAVANREDGLRVVEAIELLISASQWQAADDLYRNRTDNGNAWKNLPAARLGQRAASAFVATPARRQAFTEHLSVEHLGFYRHEVGLHALNSGDLVTAREHMNAANAQYEDADSLQDLTECLCQLGELDAALQAAERHISVADRARSAWLRKNAAATRGWALMLTGDTYAAEEQFTAAAQISRLTSLWGVWWGEFLARTGRLGPAQSLTDLNRAMCEASRWNDDVARCDRLLGFLDLAAEKPSVARARLTAAAATFRDGDFLAELAATLPMLAESARLEGDLDAADRHVIEALTIAGPRQLVLAQMAALTARALTAADRAAAGQAGQLELGRDAADAAHRLAVRRRAAWHELAALDAYTRLDTIEGADHGWATQGIALRNRLIPNGLNLNPTR
jgi:hypothetical protein